MSDIHHVCPKCSCELPDLEPGRELTTCPSCQHPVVTMPGSVRQCQTQESVENGQADGVEPDPAETDENGFELEKLLPPKFLVDDPDFQGHHNQQNVLLPDGKGGITSVKRNVVKVQHKGETFELVALAPERRRRRQLMWNGVWIGIGILFLWLVLSMI